MQACGRDIIKKAIPQKPVKELESQSGQGESKPRWDLRPTVVAPGPAGGAGGLLPSAFALQWVSDSWLPRGDVNS